MTSKNASDSLKTSSSLGEATTILLNSPAFFTEEEIKILYAYEINGGDITHGYPDKALMMSGDNSPMKIIDIPSLRRANLLQLFSEFVSTRMAQSPSQQINGLDREFAAQIQVHNTYFSGMKSGARTIGDKLARQIEVLCSKPRGWMDETHSAVEGNDKTEKPEEKTDELLKFLEMAQRAYLAAPRSRAKLVKMMEDVLNQQ